MNRPRRAALLAAAALMSAAAMASYAGGSAAAEVTRPVLPQVLKPALAQDVSSGPTTLTNTVTRTHLVNGQDVTAESDNVSVTVSQTTNLRSQRVQVNWTGAHPTGYIANDPTSYDARTEEYPMLLIECRGVSDDHSLPAQDQLSPKTCWSQDPNVERYQESRNANALFPPYRLDRNALPTERQAVVGDPTKCSPDASADDAPVSHRVPFIGVDGTDFQGGCASQAPEATSGTSTDANPGNTSYAATGTDGTGSDLFTVWTDADNSSLGCNASVPCSLVAVPIIGISCDATAAALPAVDRPANYATDGSGTYAPGAAPNQMSSSATACMAKGKSAPGSVASGQALTQTNLAVTGALWWSASNWKNKIVFPLNFAPSSSICSLTGNLPQAQVFGSELMVQAAGQWTPALCGAEGGYQLKHVQTGEPQARSLLDSDNIDAGFTTDAPPGGYQLPTVSAPTAVTGFSVGYVIDGPGGARYQSLKLDARLLAKLLTESYPADTTVADEYASLKGNPLNITEDPEFLALNPTLTNVLARDVQLDTLSVGSMLFLSSNSDVIYAMTSYIAADPEARSWLDGVPDPWGMRVNPNYQTNFGGDDPQTQLTLPLNHWPLLDSFEPPGYTEGGSPNTCYSHDPVPFLPIVANPTIRLENITQNLVIARPTTTFTCTNPDTPEEKLAQAARQPVGQRFIIGILPTADTDRFAIDSAALETSTATTAPVKFTDTTGRTFVGPTDAGMLAAAKAATPDDPDGVFTISPATLRASDPAAYPGTMIVSTAVHTSGVDAQDAANFASFLNFVAGDGQAPGQNNGQLAEGYVPITAADGLGAFVTHTKVAALAVAAQNGDVPSLEATSLPTPAVIPSATPSAAVQPVPTTPSVSSSPTPVASSASPTAHAAAAPVSSPTTAVPVDTGIAAALGLPVAATATTPAVDPVTATSAPVAQSSDQPTAVANVTKTKAIDVGAAGIVIPLILLLGLACGVGALGAVWNAGRKELA